MLTEVLNYSKQGWHVFPLQPNGKAPLVAGGFKQATTDTEQIQKWWTANPAANIGIALDASGLCVVDVDTHGDINGFESLPLLGDLPETAVARTPSGGAHYVFNNAGTPPPRKVGIVRGIDLLANGYIVAAPSVINGKAYSWEKKCDVVDLPGHVRELAAPKIQPVAQPFKPDEARLLHRASMWLDACDPAYQGQNGHSSLLWAAQGLINGFMLSRSEALDLLWNEYNPRCMPAWDRSKPSDVRDFERKVDQAEMAPVKKRGWLIADEEEWVPPSWMLTFISNIASRPSQVAVASEEELKDLDKRYSQLKKLDEPDWRPPGLVGDIMEFILTTAHIPQPKYAIAAALTTMGTLLGQKVKSGWRGGRTHLYCMAVGGTSTGKDHPISMAERILEQSGVGHLIGGTDVTSDSAIEKRLNNEPVTLYAWDEAGHTLSGFGSNVDSHRSTVVPTLMKLWSSGHKTYRGKDRAGRENDAFSIKNPCLSIYGTGSTDKIASSLRSDQLNDGWLPRCLYFISADLGLLAEVDDNGEVVPEHILERCRTFAQFINPAVTEVSVFSTQAKTQDWTITVPVEDDAKQALVDFAAEARKLQQSGQEACELWGKAAEQADRIALIVACGQVYDLRDARVQLSDVQWAIEVVRYCIKSFTSLIADKVVDNEYEGNVKLVLERIKRAGRKGISKHQLTRSLRKIKGFERADILRTLEEGRDILVEKQEGTSKPTTVYIYRPD